MMRTSLSLKPIIFPNISPVLFSLSIPSPPQLHSVVITVMLVPKTWLQKHCGRLLLLIRVCAIYVSTPLIIAQRLRKPCFSLEGHNMWPHWYLNFHTQALLFKKKDGDSNGARGERNIELHRSITEVEDLFLFLVLALLSAYLHKFIFGK